MKNLFSVMLLIIFFAAFTVNVSAVAANDKHNKMNYGKHELYCDGNHNNCDCVFYESLINITNGDETDEDWDNITSEPEGTGKVLSMEQVTLFKNKQLAMSYQYSFDKLNEKYCNSGDLDLCVEYEIYTADKYMYDCAISVVDSPLITAEKVLDILNIPTDEEITAIRIFEHIHLPKDAVMDSGYWSALYRKYITKTSFINLSDRGWQEIDNQKFYVKSDGSIIKKSCKINGIRYKFTSDGVCQGKYTGWTKSSKGRSYYKNGVMLKKIWIKTKSGKRYYAGGDGYMTTGWYRADNGWCYFNEKNGQMSTGNVEINGNTYTFSSDGIWDGLADYDNTKIYNTLNKKLSKDDYGGIYFDKNAVVVMSKNGSVVKKLTGELKKLYAPIITKECKYSINELETVKSHLIENQKKYGISTISTDVKNNRISVEMKKSNRKLNAYLDMLDNDDIVHIEYTDVMMTDD